MNIPDTQGIRLLQDSLQESFYNRVKETKNEKLKNERLFAYSLLERLYKTVYRDKLPTVTFSESGKPYLTGCSIGISLSHTDSLVLAAISDTGEVGCDAEIYPDERREEKLEERFLKDFHMLPRDDTGSDIILIPFYFDFESGEVKTYTPEGENDRVDTVFSPGAYFVKALAHCGKVPIKTDNVHGDGWYLSSVEFGDVCKFVHKWTCAEALLKLSGKGFSDYNSLHMIQKQSTTYTFTLDAFGKKYSLSVAAPRE